MNKLGFWLTLFLVVILLGCQTQQNDILVLSDRAKGNQKFVVNGGPGSTEATYADEKGREWEIVSNTVKVPIEEDCEEPVQTQAPEEIAIEEFKPVVSTTVGVNAYPNQILIASQERPDVSFYTEVAIPKQPPKIRLIKSSDQDTLCCDRDLTFRIRYVNEGGDDAYNIRIWDNIPANVEFIEESAAADPFFANVFIKREGEKARRITWVIEGPVGPGEEGEVFYSVGCPKERPSLICGLRFEPKNIKMGEQGIVICKISNTGTGPATNVNLDVNLPAGLEHEGEVEGKSLNFKVDKLEANDTMVREFFVTMQSGGRLDNITANVVSEQGVSCECTVPPTPTLSIDKSGPRETINRNSLTYTIVVRNNSSQQAPATNCILTDKLPANTEFKNATEEGSYDKDTHIVTWNLGVLMPGQIITREVTIRPDRAGNFRDEAMVTCDEGISVTDDAVTIVKGYAAMHISKYDTEDPVMAGETTTYVVEVRNEGFKDATGIQLSNVIPELSEFVSAKGTGANGEEIEFTLDGQTVNFGELPILESGEKAVYNITVKAASTGELLNRTSLRYNEFDKEIVVEEPTTAYE